MQTKNRKQQHSCQESIHIYLNPQIQKYTFFQIHKKYSLKIMVTDHWRRLHVYAPYCPNSHVQAPTPNLVEARPLGGG